MKPDRIQRLLRLILLLQSGQARSAEDLMQELQVSRRTLFRDLKVIEEAGIPYEHSRREGYFIHDEFFLPPIDLTMSETMALLVLGKTVAQDRHRPMHSPVLSAIIKLINAIPEPMRLACSEMLNQISVGPAPVEQHGKSEDHYHKLQHFIEERETVILEYASPIAKPVRLKVDPYALHFSQRAWYLFGWSHEHSQVRIFKLARIQSIQPTAFEFKPPAGFTPADKIGKAWRLIAEGTIHQIELDFKPQVATNVSEVRWHPSQKNEFLSDGSCRVTFEVDGLEEISWWILGYGDQVIIRKPAKLKQLVARRLKAAAEQYDER